MAHENKTLSDIQKASDSSDFVASLYHWGANGAVVYILGEYCGGGRLTNHIKPNVGIGTDADFWRLSFQLARGIADIHQAGLTTVGIRVR